MALQTYPRSNAFPYSSLSTERLKVTFDSNAWEAIFGDESFKYEQLRKAIKAGRLGGFICEAAFKIEAVRKADRGSDFAKPHSDLRIEGVVERDGQRYLKMSFGPADERHPGMPSIQVARLQAAKEHDFRLLRGMAWMGLPSPLEISDPALFAEETKDEAREREQRQINAFALIEARGVGHAAFMAADGWNMASSTPDNEKRFMKACAEWADGEMVCAHVAYQNDILCTNDRARNAGSSVLNPENQAWLSATFKTVFMTPIELLHLVYDQTNPT